MPEEKEYRESLTVGDLMQDDNELDRKEAEQKKKSSIEDEITAAPVSNEIVEETADESGQMHLPEIEV